MNCLQVLRSAGSQSLHRENSKRGQQKVANLPLGLALAIAAIHQCGWIFASENLEFSVQQHQKHLFSCVSQVLGISEIGHFMLSHDHFRLSPLLQLLQALSPGCPDSKQKPVLSIGWTSLVVSHIGWLLLWG